MSDNKQIFLVFIAYTSLMFLVGMELQKHYDQHQLAGWQEQTWTTGCNQCAQWEKNQCARDQLQGVECKPYQIKGGKS